MGADTAAATQSMATASNRNNAMENASDRASCSEGEQTRSGASKVEAAFFCPARQICARCEGAVLLFGLIYSAALIVGGCSPPINNNPSLISNIRSFNSSTVWSVLQSGDTTLYACPTIFTVLTSNTNNTSFPPGH
jgi:hypothetical protein